MFLGRNESSGVDGCVPGHCHDWRHAGYCYTSKSHSMVFPTHKMTRPFM